ncbi:MAG: Si-specific NAD(P)(+) transhydrogenase [Pirellulaceae bacterium]|nr:Si-specific NAD(P)(+) transhydrogenase [Pirellulaceae bacterium]
MTNLSSFHSDQAPQPSYDLVVIGGGPAGVNGAITAGMLGKRVLLIEKEPVVGGAGINTGTIPSKTLRETALVLSGGRSRRLFGVDLSLRREATIADFMCHEKHVKTQERKRSECELARRGVTTLRGHASFVDSHTIRMVGPNGDETSVYGEKILIATGSSPLRPPEFHFEDDRIHDSNEILELAALPRKLVVIGAGVIGCEYAGTFAALGTEVHLVDGRDILLPFLDREISLGLVAAMSENGIRFHWKTKVLQCDTDSSGNVAIQLSSGDTLKCDGVLVCAGRSSNTQTLNVFAAGLTLGARGLVQVNSNYQSTEASHIYAAGDVIGAPALAATGIEQARVAVCHAFDAPWACGVARLLPTGIYTIPEASFVGDTEETLTARQVPYIVGRCRYSDIPRGDIIGDHLGFLKLLYHRDDMRLLGVHVMGEQATEVVHLGLLAMTMNATAELFHQVCFNYPTLGDLYKYATHDAMMKRRAL